MRYNIVVMPSTHDSMREYSISKFTLVFLGTFFFLIVAVAVLGITGGVIVYKQNRQIISENTGLTKENERLEGYMENYIERVHKMDQKIRSVFFGIEEQEEAKADTESNGLLGQGGNFNPNPPDNIEETGSGTIVGFKAKEFDENLPLIDRIKFVESSIKEIYDFAVGKEKEIGCTPSRNPVQVERGKYWFSSGFGWRIHPLTRRRDFHSGLDISAREGTEIYAPANGVVCSMPRHKFLGKTLRIKHGQKYETVYGHLFKYAEGLRVGKTIKRGELIGYIGDTGRATGPHLHYEIHVDGKAINPIRYILDSSN